MRAVIISSHGGPEVLELREIEEVEPGPGQIRVEVRASALNRADLLQRRGMYPAPAGVRQDVPGLEFAGVVEKLGPGVEGLEVGDRVMGLVPGGGCAQRVVVHAREAVPVPAGLGLDEAGAIPEAFMTAYDAVHLQCGLRMGEGVLIHAVGSGVGTAAVQLARAAGARTLGTSRSAWKLAGARACGLEVGIDASSGEFVQQVLDATGGKGVEVVLDLVGGGYTAQNLQVARPQGRVVTVGLIGGAKAEVPLRTLMARRLTWRGTVLRARPLEEKISLAQDFAQRVVPGFASGALRPIIDRLMPIEEIVEGHRHMESNANFGKIVMTWPAQG